jgi:leucyl-tRNA synthetase
VSQAPVNWCPALGTALANEEVTADGRSERGNFPVFKRSLKQWMMRITAYADRLIEDLDHLDWPASVKLMQRNWIGRSTGGHISFPSPAGAIRVFTTRPDTVFGATYMVLAPEHELVSALVGPEWPADIPASDGRPRDPVGGGGGVPFVRGRGVRSGAYGRVTGEDRRLRRLYATNPVTGGKIPISSPTTCWPAAHRAIMAVPGQDERDWEFAEV